MKSLLASTLVFALSAPLAMAEVTLSGSARMGILQDFGSDDTGFTSRARVSFALSGETDGGLSFGATFRADNATDANIGEGGEVFLSGAFGKLTMGDIDGAAQSAVGHVSGVGLTGLSDLNEITYLGGGGNDYDDPFPPLFGATDDPTARYEYSTGGFTGYISATNPPGTADAVALGVKYTFGDYSVAAGYESLELATTEKVTNVVLGATATFGAVTAKVVWSELDYEFGGENDTQLALSVDYVSGPLTVTGFYMDSEDAAPSVFGGEEAFGLGASYDLGGGAKVMGGYVRNDTIDTDAFDMGLSFAF